MTRWIGPIALAAALALVAIAILLAPAPRISTADAVAAELRCPDCQALSVAESRTAAAAAIRREIAAQLAAGRTPDAVRQYFVDRYGQWILLRPASPLVWVAPLVTVAAAAGLLGWWLLRPRTAAPRAGAPVDEATRRRLADESEALDA